MYPLRVLIGSLGTFRLEYESLIEYKYDFSNLVLKLSIIRFHINWSPLQLVSNKGGGGGGGGEGSDNMIVPDPKVAIVLRRYAVSNLSRF